MYWTTLKLFQCADQIDDLSPVYTTTFLARYPFKFGPGAYNFRPGALHFCRVNGKIRGTSTPKQTSAETMWIGSLGPRMFWGTRATIFSIYTTKMEGAGPKILGTGAKFKQVPGQKNCRVNWAFMYLITSYVQKKCSCKF